MRAKGLVLTLAFAMTTPAWGSGSRHNSGGSGSKGGGGGGASSGYDSRSGASGSGRSLLGDEDGDAAKKCPKGKKWHAKSESCVKKCKKGKKFSKKKKKCVPVTH